MRASKGRIIRIIKPSLLLQAIARLPCRSHFAVHAVQSGLLRGRGNRCLVLLLSERFSLNKTAVNRGHGFPVLS